jgi:transcriptional regulator with GAF, ATPase, and Fis domain
VKLLRVLQEKAIRPVGSTKTISVDVRIISATHRDLENELEQGNFRED